MEQLGNITRAQLEPCTRDALGVLRGNLPRFTQKFQASNSEDNFYPQSENVEWTTGFCTGEYWLAWQLSGEEAFKQAALAQVDSFLHRIENHIDTAHHDMGFLYTPSCVAAYRLCGSKAGRRAALLAADELLGRFQQKGAFFQAWGQLGAADNYRLIIDCLMNLPLLYWATEETKDPVYRERALAHTATSLENLIRPDHSTYHTFFFEPATGAPLRGVTAQGYRNGSAWARGQAWGIYGLALSYKYTAEQRCIDLFYKVTDFFLSKLPAGGVPYWDLDFTESDGEPRDSSAAAIAACGMLEMAKYLPAAQAGQYTGAAQKLALALAESCAVRDPAVSNGLLLHGVYAKSSPYNTVADRGVDECNTWGDYFWLELLVRLSTDWDPYW